MNGLGQLRAAMLSLPKTALPRTAPPMLHPPIWEAGPYAHVRLSGLSDEGNASQNSCSGAPAAAPASGSESDTVHMMSALLLRSGSNPLAQPPTTRQTPSGLEPQLPVG